MAPGHFIPHRKLSLYGEINLNHLDYTRRKLIAAFQPFNLLRKNGLGYLNLVIQVFLNASNLFFYPFIVNNNVLPFVRRMRRRPVARSRVT